MNKQGKCDSQIFFRYVNIAIFVLVYFSDVTQDYQPKHKKNFIDAKTRINLSLHVNNITYVILNNGPSKPMLEFNSKHV